MNDHVIPPKQARSRESWNRVLSVSLDLLAHGGFDAFTISEVCKRADVTAPSIYARVEGRSGLIAAAYELGMESVRASEGRELERTDGSAASVAVALARVFQEHEGLMRTVIARASADALLRERGAALAQAVTDRFGSAVTTMPRDAGQALVRTIFTECAFRAVYGQHFWDAAPETPAAFKRHLVAIANAAEAAA